MKTNIIICAIALCGCQAIEESGNTGGTEWATESHAEDDRPGQVSGPRRPGAENGAELVYESVVRKVDDEVVSFKEAGVFDEDKWRRVNRPAEFLDRREVLDDMVWGVGDSANGIEEYGYRVFRRDVEAVTPDPRPEKPAELDPRLVDMLETLNAEAILDVSLKVRGPAADPLPLLPQLGTVSAADYSNAMAKRKLALQAQVEAFDERTSDLITAIAAVRGTIVDRSPRSGWLEAKVPAGEVESLLSHPDVARIVGPEETTATTRYSMDEIQQSDIVDSQRFNDASYYGQNSSGTPYRVGVFEGDGLEDEVCYTDDVGGACCDECDTDERLKLTTTCAGSSCTKGSFSEANEDYHGTLVTSVIAADYTQNQALGYDVGQDDLSSGWEEEASGMVREADIYYYKIDDGGWNDAAECAQGIGTDCVEVDVANSSLVYTTKNCTPTTDLNSAEEEYENMFDDGVFSVGSAGNNGSTCSNTTCLVRSPHDLPKAFMVGGVEDTSGDYNDWPRMCEAGPKISPHGGATVDVGSSDTGEMSIVDLAAPCEMNFMTDDAGSYGTILEDATGYHGTSISSPVVAGAAVAVLDWLWDTSGSWIGNVGRLHTVMLAMGDRGSPYPNHAGCDVGDTLVCGSDNVLGLGRLKLRLLKNNQGMDPWGWSFLTTTITTSSSDPYKYLAFSEIPTGAEMVKCVMQQVEDMSDKEDISAIGLRLQIRNKSGGSCQLDQGTVNLEREDDFVGEDKHMVAVVDSSTNIEGKCLQVNLDRDILSTDNSVVVHTFCYYAGILDDEPN